MRCPDMSSRRQPLAKAMRFLASAIILGAIPRLSIVYRQIRRKMARYGQSSDLYEEGIGRGFEIHHLKDFHVYSIRAIRTGVIDGM